VKKRAANRPTLRLLAEKAGLSIAAVSLALRDHPSIPESTCARVKRLAAAAGYRPDPEIGKLMAYLRQRREVRTTAALGLLTMFPDPRPWESNPILRRHLAGATERAQQLGYRLVDFWRNTPGMTAERLRGILQARGIEGLVILGTPTWVESIDFDLGRFACATIGYSVRMPIHRSSPHQYEELLQALRRLEQLGYRRPGLILSENSDRRTLQHYSSAFLRWQWGRARDQLVPLEVQPQLGYDEFKRWFTAGRPDVVIAQAPEAPIYLEWLRKLGRPAPARCGFVSLDVDPTLDFVCSGIRQNCEMAAAAAVDLVVAQIQRRERGLPTLPKVVLIEGTWVDGVTTRAQ
jgi:LacI family transcriptional regulator